jgi:ubiquinone/menaquinone biosynthesis C-methylase UbiE
MFFVLESFGSTARFVTLNTVPEYAKAAPSQTDPWEEAYLRFETPEQEVRKFVKRLRALGVDRWSRDAEVAELFCGRGNGLRALEILGFKHIEGVDLSPRLVAQYHGYAKCYVGDCRELPFADRSKDALIVQGGLHHLPILPDDLDRALSEGRRVLRREGNIVLVEPWLTPFLRFAHAACEARVARRLSNKGDALAVMTEHERGTYEAWLSSPDLVLGVVRKHFVPVRQSIAWGKWSFVGKPL